MLAQARAGWQAEAVSSTGRGTQSGGPDEAPSRVSVGKAVAIVVVAVVLGVILLGVAARPPVSESTSVTATTLPAGTPTTVPGATTTTVHGVTTTTAHGVTTTTAHGATTTTKAASATGVPHSQVRTLVANGTSTAGAAATFTTLLKNQGWGTLSPADTTSPVTSSTIYYAPGQVDAANTIAAELGLATTNVKALTSSVPVSSTSGVDVLVVVGPDLANQKTS
jgi:LytR cell envelope-related transcriptional attenuator